MGGPFLGVILNYSDAEGLGERADSYMRLYKLAVYEGTLIFYSLKDEGVPEFNNVKKPNMNNLYFIDKCEEIKELASKRESKRAFEIGNKVIKEYIRKAKEA